MCFCVCARALFSHGLLLTRAAGSDTVVGVEELLSWQRVVAKYSTALCVYVCVCARARGWHGACEQSNAVSPSEQQGELLLLDLAELQQGEMSLLLTFSLLEASSSM